MDLIQNHQLILHFYKKKRIKGAEELKRVLSCMVNSSLKRCHGRKLMQLTCQPTGIGEI
jgi:hypothetical protein